MVAKEKYKMSYIKKFNPLEMEEEEVLALATGREKLLEIMLAEMQHCLQPKSNQHYILYGPRGIGKSFFTRLLKIHHDKSELFSNSQFIQLPEEQDNINFTADLLDVIATILEGGKLADVKPKWSITPVQYQESKKRLKLAIQKVAEEKNIKHIFVTQENLQVFIPKLDNTESGRFREFLSDFNEITLIGSSLRPDLDNDYAKKLFQVFKKIDIEPWSEENFLKYYERKALRSIFKEEKLEQLKKSKNKIRAIVKFTGGSPRLAVILSNLILDKNILDTTELLDGIIDDLTSYYQDITSDIPHKSKMLFDMLIRKGENMTQSALAQSFDPPLEQSTIARSFSWLLENYYVISSKQAKGHTKHFYVRDRLYVLYYQKRQVFADMPFSFIGIFVDFLAEFYSQKEQQKEIALLDCNHPYSKGLLYHFAKKENLAIQQSHEANYIKKQLLDSYDSKLKNKLHTKNSSIDKEDDFDKAIKKYQKVIALNTDDAEAYFNLGNLFGNKGGYDKAIEAYQKAIALKPDYEEAYNKIGVSFVNKGDYDKAIVAFQKVIALKPDFEKAYSNLGILFAKNCEYEKAIEAYQKAIALKPDDEKVIYNLGNSFFNKGDYDYAIESYQKAITLKPDYNEAYYNLGNSFAEKGNNNRAIVAYQKAIALKPDHEKANYNLGYLYDEKGDYDMAIEAYQKAIALKPDYEKAYFNLGYSFGNKGEYDNAIEAYQKAIALKPGYEKAYSNLGGAFDIKGDYDKAIEAYQKAIALKPDYENTYYHLGISFDNKCNYNKAIEAYQKAIALKPDFEEAYYNLGNSFYNKGDYDKVTSTFQNGLLIIPNSKILHVGLYENLIKLKSWDLLASELMKNNSFVIVSTILGEALSSIVQDKKIEDRFFLFKKTFAIFSEHSTLNKYDFINALCLALYRNNIDHALLEQIIDELDFDSKEDVLLGTIINVFKYLIAPDKYDINEIHPDARTIIESILAENKKD